MTAIVQAFRRLAFLFRKPRFDRELDAEIVFHIESRAEDLMADGMTRDAARERARREFGSKLRAREGTWAAWQIGWLEDSLADLRYAIRGLRRSPSFTLTAVTLLALGIGGTSATFAALDAVLWKTLPVSAPQTLVRLSLTRVSADETGLLPLDYVQQLRQSDIFSELIVVSVDGLSFTYDDRAERILGEVVSPNFFTFVGITPAMGRGFASNARADRWAPEAVISYRFWQRRFGADPGVIGRTIHLNTYPFTIVGVSPDSFFDVTRGQDPELRIPVLPDGSELAQISQISGAGERRMSVLARLRPSMTVQQAEAAANTQFQEWLRSTSLPSNQRARYGHALVRPAGSGWQGSVATFRTPLFVLFGLVVIVLLIACANVASISIARAVARHRELAIRASIGAGRGRLVRQLLTESLVLSCLGGLAGIGVACWTVNVLAWFLPQGHVSLVVDLRPDNRVVAFAFALSFLTGFVGLVPAMNGTRGALAAALKVDSTGSIGRTGNAGIRQALVVIQVAFSIVLLIVAGLFIHTLANLHPTEFQGATDRVVLFTIKPQQEIYTADRVRRLVTAVIERTRILPGVRSVALAENGPLGSRSDAAQIETTGGGAARATLDMITPGLFDTIGVPRIAGRDFSFADTIETPPVAIVNQALAQALFKGANPIGRPISMPQDPKHRQFEIVGVVADAHYYDLRAAPSPGLWINLLQQTPYMPTLHVRTATDDTASIVSLVRRELDQIDKGFPIFNVKTFERRIEDLLARERMIADISATFGAVALLLAGIGLYGILAYAVSQRTREIGIRVALGSTTRSVLWLVARQAIVLVSLGIGIGAVIGALADRFVSVRLVAVSPVDVPTLGAATAAMLVIAAIAAALPAYRASRLDPTITLRAD